MARSAGLTAWTTRSATYLSQFAVSRCAAWTGLTTSLHNLDLPVDLIARSGEDLAMMRSTVCQNTGCFGCVWVLVQELSFWTNRFCRDDRVGAMWTSNHCPVSTNSHSQKPYGQWMVVRTRIGHQWWGNLTTLDDARACGSGTGMSEYSFRIVLEYAFGTSEVSIEGQDNLIDSTQRTRQWWRLPVAATDAHEHTLYADALPSKVRRSILRGYLGDSLYRRIVCHTHLIVSRQKWVNSTMLSIGLLLTETSGPGKIVITIDDHFQSRYTGFYVDSFYPSPILSRAIFISLKLQSKPHHADHLCHDAAGSQVHGRWAFESVLKKRSRWWRGDLGWGVNFRFAFQPVFSFKWWPAVELCCTAG